MSICLECGDVEIYYVPSCGDPAVGSSVVLLFAGQALADLKLEIATVEAALDGLQAPTDHSQAGVPHDAVANMLKDYIDPAGSLPAKHVVQVFDVRSRKYNYIRSDKMRNHLRSYSIRPQLLEPAQVGGMNDPKQLDKPGLVEAWNNTKQKISEDLSAGIQSEGTLIQGNTAGSISDLWENNFTAWVDGINDSLVVSKSGDNYDLSAGAQLLRAYAGFKLNLGHNPADNSYGLGLSGNARANLAEAKAELTGYLPDRDGWHALLEMADPNSSGNGQSTTSQRQLDFGYFRFKAQISADAMVGASIMGTIGIEYKPEADGTVNGRGSDANGKGGVAAGAFAGVEAAAEVKGGLEWDNPEKRRASGTYGWATVFEVGVTIAANAGIGISVEFHIEYYEATGKIYVRGGAQLVIGVGARGGITAALGLNTMYDFVVYLYHQLVANDFSLLTFIAPKAYEAMRDLVLYAIQEGIDLAVAVGEEISQMFLIAKTAVLTSLANEEKARQFARNVQRNPSILTFASPETKGAILYRLSETFWFGREEHQEGAILVLMESINFKREWDQVVERVTTDGSKGSAAVGLSRLNYVLDGGSQRNFNIELARIQSAIEMVPDTPVRYYA